MTWPILLDYTRDECKRILRKLELEAYASIVSAFRAQGELSKEKKKLLQDLCSSLSISVERHRAEIRRAVNDEKLGTVAERMAGPNTSMEWAVEGRRLIPLMPRLVPQTAFTALANNLADLQASKNAAMPIPSSTGRNLKLEIIHAEELPENLLKRKNSVSGDSSGIPIKVPAMSPSPTSNVPTMSEIVQLSPIMPQQQMILPLSPLTPTQATPISSVASRVSPITPLQTPTSSSGASLIMGSPLTPLSSLPIHSTSVQTSILPITITSTMPAATVALTSTPISGIARGTNRGINTIIQRPIAPAMQATTHQSIGHGSKQVILLSGSTANIPPSILQRCLSVPVVKNINSPAITVSASTGPVTKITSAAPQTLIPVSITGSSTAMVSQIGSNNNMVVYTTTNRGRGGGRGSTGIRQAVVRPRPSLVVPIQQQAAAASGMHASSALIGLSGLVSSQQSGQLMKTTGRGSRGKHSGTGRGMKIGPQMMMLASPNTTSTRILPKPTMSHASVAAALGNFSSISQTTLASPLVVMGSANLPASITKGGTLVQSSTPRIVNVMSVTPAPNRIMPPANTYSGGTKFSKIAKSATSNIMTVGGFPSTTTTLSTGSGSGAKPNVIVVHKASPAWHQVTQQQTHPQILGKANMTKGIRLPKISSATTVSKMLSNMHAAVEGVKRTTSSPIVQALSSGQQLGSQQSPESFDATQLDPSNLDPKNTLLADLIQAAGIVLPEGTTATMPVSASAFKTLPSNIASSSLRKIAGLTGAGLQSAVTPTGLPVSFPTRKGPQMRAPPKSSKLNTSTPKKVITQTIPKYPPSITISQQMDTDIDEISPHIEQTMAPKVKVESVKVSDVTIPEETITATTSQDNPEIVSLKNEDLITQSNVFDTLPEVKLETTMSNVSESIELVTETTVAASSSSSSLITTYHSDVFTADITPETSMADNSGLNLQQDLFTTEIITGNVDTATVTPMTIVENIKTETDSIISVTPSVVEETMVLDSSSATIVDEAGNPIEHQVEEGQVFEIQASEDVIKMLASGQLTKEVLSLFQKLGVKFDGDTPLTLETTITEEEIEEPAGTSNTEEITTTTIITTPETTSTVTSEVLNIQLVEQEDQLKPIEQSGSSIVDVFDSSEHMSLMDTQVDQLSSMQIVQGDDTSASVELDQQRVLTEEITSQEFVPSETNQHFVGECVTIEQQHGDLLVSEEVIGSSDVGELMSVETTVAETTQGEIIDKSETGQTDSVKEQQSESEMSVDSSGHEAMSLLEELMNQHKDNFN